MRQSLYWDKFLERAEETVTCIKIGKPIPVRRVAVFITDLCNLRCQYCNSEHQKNIVSQSQFEGIIKEFPEAIIHITGGEPSCVKWLYPFLQKNKDSYQFHLNTNAVIRPPADSIKRLKVSLDSHSKEKWEALVGRKVFDRVVENIKWASQRTVTSITCTVTHQNVKELSRFSEFCSKEFPNIYAVFFSVYKGDDPRFILTPLDANYLFNMREDISLNEESLALIRETIDEKKRITQKIRFPENKNIPCYISLSERVFDHKGMSSCSHLYRDGIRNKPGEIHPKCLYGCNRRLVAFNEEVYRRLGGKNG